MKPTPVISIITVVYNGAETLEHTVRSVVQQTYPGIEYIIIDGGSVDDTLEILGRYRDKIAVLISEKDQGIYDAMNKGLQKATGDWVYFLGADDLLSSPTIIHDVVQQFANSDSVYYGDTYLKNRNRMYEGQVSLMKLSLCNISHQAIFYPKSVYTQKPYNTRYPFFADHIYNLELFGNNGKSFRYLPMLISIYNDQGRSSTIRDDNYAKDIIGVIYKNFGLPLAGYVWLRRKVAKIKNKIINKKTAY